MSADTLWYVARGAGVVTLLLLSLNVALGIVARSGQGFPGMPGFAVAQVHRTAALLSVVLLGIHVATLLLDPYAQLTLPDVVLPFGAGYRPLWTGLGTLALDLLAAIIVTSLLRQRIGRRAWRVVHWSAYAAWPVSIGHALGDGTDSGTRWLLAMVAACVLVVGGALAWRLSAGFGSPSRTPVRRPGLSGPSGPDDRPLVTAGSATRPVATNSTAG
ncbi:ferric reductase-like transmembrane domain-containing protein [Frankia sp. R82]|uniref:ferric reductase-like transmembrane domain-containing protein n=1 Tax=Frankia sp. R82 TaxID=2950553 RepID=UPI002042CA77|nr:ferric reductase-like transmembrane domain-containing protein [Frankia sp. R82]MCM3883699.1 ferric reductase-like transmembrane domain-containing protein [Frankia sp. R82]